MQTVARSPAPNTHVNAKTTVVRIAVARFEFTLVTPTFANTAVVPAKKADRRAQTNQFINASKQEPTERARVNLSVNPVSSHASFATSEWKWNSLLYFGSVRPVGSIVAG